RTRVRTAEGWLDFQDYFVRRRCEPVVTELNYAGAATARPQPEFLSMLADARLRAVVICPSNPFLSIDPILALPGVRAALAGCPAPVVAVSPVIAGPPVKGPTAKMLAGAGRPVGAGRGGALVGGGWGSLWRFARRLSCRPGRGRCRRLSGRRDCGCRDPDDDARRARSAGPRSARIRGFAPHPSRNGRCAGVSAHDIWAV